MAAAEMLICGLSSAISHVKAKAEVTLTYKLAKRGVEVLNHTLKVKASEDAQNVFSLHCWSKRLRGRLPT